VTLALSDVCLLGAVVINIFNFLHAHSLTHCVVQSRQSMIFDELKGSKTGNLQAACSGKCIDVGLCFADLSIVVLIFSHASCILAE